MSILLFGGTGILGSQLKERLDVFAPTREEFDIINPKVKKLDKWLHSFDTVINCAVSKDSSRLNHMYHINTAFPTYLADVINNRRKKCRFIQISTDYVFGGIQGKDNQPYNEILPAFPNFNLMPEYSFTKYQAENNTLLFCGYVIRTSFYPLTPIEKAPEGKITSAEYVDQIADKITKVVNNVKILEENCFNILNVGSKKPRMALDIIRERNPDAVPFQLKQGMDFSLNTSIYYKAFENGI